MRCFDCVEIKCNGELEIPYLVVMMIMIVVVVVDTIKCAKNGNLLDCKRSIQKMLHSWSIHRLLLCVCWLVGWLGEPVCVIIIIIIGASS